MTDKSKYLFFSMGLEDFGVPLLMVREVIAMPEVTPVPQAPQYFLGLINLRGQVFSLIDLRKKLNINSTSSTDTTVIVLDFNSFILGVVVDEVKSVQEISPNEISTSSVIEHSKNYDYIEGVYQGSQGLTLILNIEKSLSLTDKLQISEVKKVA